MNPPTQKRELKSRDEQRRKDEAHALLENKRRLYIEQARRALLFRIIDVGTATADDVAEEIGPPPEGIDPRLLGAVPGALARAGLIRRSGFTVSRRPSRHASVISTWEVADWRKVLFWVIVNLGGTLL